jgi:ubiquinone/menaquinone biosynthesis C-methylase UbiE
MAGRASWDRLAAVYPRQVRWERAALEAAADLAAIDGSETLVDLGTGTGALLAELARRHPRPRVAIGFDRSAAMLARVPALPDSWRVERASVDALPLAAASAEVITAAYLLHLLDEDERGAALAEARRVLAPGGRIVCVTPTRPWWLKPLDTRPPLQSAGFTLVRARTVRRGYPSLCVLAAR